MAIQLVQGILYAGTCFSVFARRRGVCRAGIGLARHHALDDVSDRRGLSLPLQALADRPLPLGPAAAVGAAGVSGLELAVGAVCRRVLHTAVWDYADEWGNLAGLVCPKYTAYWFLLCGWVILCCAVLKVPFITLKIRLPALKSKLSYCLSGIIKAWKAKPDTERRYPP
ncbi:hypothetical protein NIA69_10750 [Gemmiger formicilis]|nr:hypothetical protein [Gemmiger formicilis]